MVEKQKKHFGFWLGVVTVALALLSLPTALAMALEGSGPSGDGDAPAAYRVTLDTQIIGRGENLSYETVAAELAGNPFAADYYPGELTVELAGQVIIEDGGCLAIGTLSAGNEKEKSPVLQGRLTSGGSIVVRAGGSLILKNVAFDLDGEGVLLVQEPGGSVVLTDTELDDSLVRWAPMMVDNTYQKPQDLWLEEGCTLSEELLPQGLDTYLLYQGVQRWETVPLRWAADRFLDQSSGEALLTGAFLDESGQTLASVRPLELAVRWYRPQQLIITSAVWMGQSAASAKLHLRELPQEATEVWGEVSADGGETWERWPRFECREEEGGSSCLFSLSDSVPRSFRVRAENSRTHSYWVSEGVVLPKGETEDSGGNRGGSTAIVVPSRKPKDPEPIPTPTPTPTQSPGFTPAPEPTLSPTVTASVPDPTPEVSFPPEPISTQPPLAVPAPEVPAAAMTREPMPVVESAPPALGREETGEPSPVVPPEGTTSGHTAEKDPEGVPTPSPSALPSAPPETTPGPAPADRGSLAPAAQVVLAAAGAAVCVLVGIGVARKKKR